MDTQISEKCVNFNILVIGMLFVCCLITSNLLELKFAFFSFSSIWVLKEILPELHITCGLLLFPFTYFFSDVLTEVYGFRVSRVIIWLGLLCLFITNLFIAITVALPASEIWGMQEAYESILGGSFRIFFASLVAYFVGELLNAWVLQKLKHQMQGRVLWFRVLTSTFLGNLVDTTLFFYLAFYLVLPTYELWHTIIVQVIFKMLFELMLVPATYKLSAYLHRVERERVVMLQLLHEVQAPPTCRAL